MSYCTRTVPVACKGMRICLLISIVSLSRPRSSVFLPVLLPTKWEHESCSDRLSAQGARETYCINLSPYPGTVHPPHHHAEQAPQAQKYTATEDQRAAVAGSTPSPDPRPPALLAPFPPYCRGVTLVPAIVPSSPQQLTWMSMLVAAAAAAVRHLRVV